MRIGVACDGLLIASQTTGCECFTCYEVDHGVISRCSNIPNMGASTLESVDLLQNMEIDVLIAHSFIPETIKALAHSKIELVTATSNNPREAAEAYLHTTLIGEEGWEQEVNEGERTDIDDLFGHIESRLLTNSSPLAS